jgi:hypothetical protein
MKTAEIQLALRLRRSCDPSALRLPKSHEDNVALVILFRDYDTSSISNLDGFK